MQNNQNLISSLIEKSLKTGASDVDVVLIENNSLSCEVRLGNLINVEQSTSISLALRVLINQQQAIVTTSDLTNASCNELIVQALTIAKAAPANPHLFLHDNPQIYQQDLQIFDSHKVSSQELIERAKNIEAIALAEPGITNSEGSQAFSGNQKTYFATSKDFFGSYQTSNFGAALSVIAGNDDKMQSGYEYSQKAFYHDLASDEFIANNAAEMASKKLNPQKIKTAILPVIFDKRCARKLLSAFAGAINGSAISRKTSFLFDKINQQIFPENINIYDDPFMLKGVASRPFDGEGVIGEKRSLVAAGIWQSYLLDTQSASKLNLKTTGHAARSMSSGPSPGNSNLYLQAGSKSLNELIGGIEKGVYVTEILGHGANITTGDFSQGVNGFYIENGQLKFPVSGITVAGKLLEIFQRITPANDLIFESSINSPSLLIDNLTVAGE